MASPTSVLSKTLQSITLSKIRELESQHKSYEARKSDLLAKVDATTDERDRFSLLLDAFRELYPSARTDESLHNFERWLAQSRYDASIPISKLASFGRELREKLDHQSRKLNMAHLYSRLLTEWMDQPTTNASPAPTDDGVADSFELVERQRQRLSELVDRFESVVFEPLETSDDEIRKSLDRLFTDENSQKALEELRKDIADETSSFMARASPFDQSSLASCIKGLLTEDILSDEKQAILRDFLESEVAQAEIADVLNMRFSDIKHWQWDAGKDGIRVMPRAGLNGKYRVWADDDILQMIFVQYIGVKLCNIVKPALKTFMKAVCKRNLDGNTVLTPAEMERRRYYLNDYLLDRNVEAARMDEYMETFFLSQLPATESSLFGGNNYDDDSDGSGSDDSSIQDLDTATQKKSGIKQQLLRRLTTELLAYRLRGVTLETRKDPGGPVALVQTDLQWYATGLSHSTVYSVMRYVGFGQDWIDFFKKYLESPLNLDAASDDRPQLGPRVRKRGVPMAHASEKLTGELVLFFMDVVVNRETGILLYRLHDDIWLLGEPTRAAKAWQCMQSFARVFGLEFNKSKTGSVYLPGATKKDPTVSDTLPTGPVSIGFLRLDQETGRWTINQKLVFAHVDQLKKQLDECKSVLSWVQTWNSCIGRFFSHTFGEPAYCFGREHVNEVLGTYTEMLQRLFPEANGKRGSVVEHLKGLLYDRFGVSDLADAFIFLPEKLGGLGLRNPFVSLFLIRNDITQTPDEIVDEYLKWEHESYLEQKKNFEKEDAKSRYKRLLFLLSPHELSETTSVKESEQDTFFSLDEFCRFRERSQPKYRAVYEELQSCPCPENIRLSTEVGRKLRAFLAENVQLDCEQRWFLQLYAEELLRDFGSMNLVDKQFLPVGVLAMMRGKKVSWNMVL
ncbi:hypothetical protein QBC40DRAFT_969 [Triangularia verruculosa]|uniref:Reverse transcriptase domain-containing protein n=1 Tax=Triangularia verruculosa TaxID=2587418 RepID=A0AAN7B294_9PEZI|nr:hypothetical protein QBC40DRAFT_969 [Triangularia verruculosa]